MSQIEWNTTEIRGFKKLEMSHPFPAQAKTGAFVPQDPAYLQEPADALLAAFAAALKGHAALPPVLYKTAQRWGSAFPAPAASAGRDDDGRGPHARDVAGTAYDASPLDAFADNFRPDAPQKADDVAADDFCDGGDSRLFYAGDFCSRRPPGVEAAALSALHAAQCIARRLT